MEPIQVVVLDDGGSAGAAFFTALGAIATLAAVVVAVWQSSRARRDARSADERAGRAEHRAEKAEQRAEKAEAERIFAARSVQAARVRHRAEYRADPHQSTDAHVTVRVTVRNGSDNFLYDVQVEPRSPLGPGYGKTSPLDVSDDLDAGLTWPKDLNAHMTWGAANAPARPLYDLLFTDEAGTRWRRTAVGELSVVAMQPDAS